MTQGKRIGAGQRAARQVPVLDSYGRLSRVPETGELEKIVTQFTDNRKVIERLGGAVGEELADGLSAWNPKVRRPKWERLLARARDGLSDGIVVWHTDRLFRIPQDLETLIALADSGFRVASAHGTRDLADPDDRFILRIEVAHAARSSDDTQRRIKRRLEQLRRDGFAHFRARSFGFPGLDRGAETAASAGDFAAVDLDSLGADEDIMSALEGVGRVRGSAPRKPVSAKLVRRERAALKKGTRAARQY